MGGLFIQADLLCSSVRGRTPTCRHRAGRPHHGRYRSGLLAWFISAKTSASFSGPCLSLNAIHAALNLALASSSVLASPSGAPGMLTAIHLDTNQGSPHRSRSNEMAGRGPSTASAPPFLGRQTVPPPLAACSQVEGWHAAIWFHARNTSNISCARTT